jgi:hypothetical protein
MMAYNTQNHWVFGLYSSSGILRILKQLFGKWNCFCPQMRGGRHLALSKRSNGLEFPSPEDELNGFSKMLCFLVFRIPENGRSSKTK